MSGVRHATGEGRSGGIEMRLNQREILIRSPQLSFLNCKAKDLSRVSESSDVVV